MPGLHDHAVLPSVFAAWCEALVAPRKEAIWSETAGHMVPAEDPAAFNRDVVRSVRDTGLIGG